MADRRADMLAGFAVFAAACLVFGVALGTPGSPCFDEIYYVPAARGVFGTAPVLNPEHPVLAKLFIRAGIALFGDGPIGWRAPGVAAGAMVAVGLYSWARLLLRARVAALWVAGVTVLDQCLYLFARTAVLDVYAAAFIVWAFVFETRAALSRTPARDLALCGACLGLAAACKWTGLFAFATVIGLTVFRRTGAALRQKGGFFRMRRKVPLALLPVLLGAVPLAAYAATFLPVYGLHPAAIWARQVYMLRYQTSHFGPQPFDSPWWAWPVPLRPFYFYWQLAPAARHGHGIIYLGNPAISWAGLAALLACLFRFVRLRDRAGGAVLAAWAGLYLPWAAAGRNITYVYYYFPAYLTLGLALALVLFGAGKRRPAAIPFAFLGVAAAVFVYFLPVSVASIGFGYGALAARLWLPGWH